MAENINNGFVLFTEGEISDFIDSTDAANTKNRSNLQFVDADLVDISEPDLDKLLRFKIGNLLPDIIS